MADRDLAGVASQEVQAERADARDENGVHDIQLVRRCDQRHGHEHGD